MSATTPWRTRLRNWIKDDTSSEGYVGADQVREKRRKYGPIIGALWAVKCWILDTWAHRDPVGPRKYSPSYIPMPEGGTKDLYKKQGWQSKK